MTGKSQTPPKGTGTNGAKLWRDVLGKYELEEHESVLLREAVRTVDRVKIWLPGDYGDRPLLPTVVVAFPRR